MDKSKEPMSRTVMGCAYIRAPWWNALGVVRDTNISLKRLQNADKRSIDSDIRVWALIINRIAGQWGRGHWCCSHVCLQNNVSWRKETITTAIPPVSDLISFGKLSAFPGSARAWPSSFVIRSGVKRIEVFGIE